MVLKEPESALVTAAREQVATKTSWRDVAASLEVRAVGDRDALAGAALSTSHLVAFRVVGPVGSLEPHGLVRKPPLRSDAGAGRLQRTPVVTLWRSPDIGQRVVDGVGRPD